MKNTTRCNLWKKGVYPLLLMVLLVVFVPQPLVSGTQAESADSTNYYSGQDMLGFKTAADMYGATPVIPFDSNAAALIKQVDILLVNQSPENNPVRNFLIKLETYSKCKEVWQAMQKWKTTCVALLKKRNLPPYSHEIETLFAEGNKFYRDAANSATTENLDNASQKYRIILVTYHAHKDARNNLALVDIHLGHNLCALLELEILRELAPQYAPALVNLTVIYERLGRSKGAETLAEHTQKKYPQLPQAIFNAAWYLNCAGKFDNSDQLLKPLLTMEIDPKYRRLGQRNEKARENLPITATSKTAGKGDEKGAVDINETSAENLQRGFWDKGLMGIMGGKSSWFGWALAIIVFIFLTLLFVAIWAGLSMAFSKTRTPPFLFTNILGIFFYVLCWGKPVGAWWVAAILYALFFYSLCNDSAKTTKR